MSVKRDFGPLGATVTGSDANIVRYLRPICWPDSYRAGRDRDPAQTLANRHLLQLSTAS